VSTAAGVFALADWGRRFAAYALDLLIVGLPLFVVDVFIGFAALFAAGFGTTGNTISTKAEVALVLLNVLVPSGYAVMFLRFGGRTIGMMAANIRAVDRTTGGPLSTAQTLRRVLAFFLLVSIWSVVGLVVIFHNSTGSAWPAVFTYMGVAGALTTGLWAIWNPLNQTLHDKAADTVVVYGWTRR
jgi:uncharacterized RDD family membrane protein YckC